jgi:hypothetical protein
MNEEFINEFTSEVVHKIDENSQKLVSCIRELGENEIWKRPNPHSNSVGNIILHLCGNISQYAISSLGSRKDVREREKEFSADGGYSGSELLKKLTDTLDEAKNIIQNISGE